MAVVKRKKRKAPKDTPAKQYARFLEMAEELGTSKDPKDFDKAFKRDLPKRSCGPSAIAMQASLRLAPQDSQVLEQTRGPHSGISDPTQGLQKAASGLHWRRFSFDAQLQRNTPHDQCWDC